MGETCGEEGGESRFAAQKVGNRLSRRTKSDTTKPFDSHPVHPTDANHHPSATERLMNDSARDRQIQAITRPDKALMTYYVLRSLVAVPLFPVLCTYLYFRYHTMRYRFTDDGISMSWGILFRREVIVNYARIQDIHLQSNVVERWLGLARILVQTASGSSSAEMTIEGLKEFELLRDFLYARTRGIKDHHGQLATVPQTLPASAMSVASTTSPDELAGALREVAGELRAIRVLLEKRQPSSSEETSHV
jgi:putative membrane protein